MNYISKSIMNVQPELLERRCGGWLGLSPRSVPIRIGVTGSTKEDVTARYFLSIRKWVETLYNADDEEKENQTN